MPPLSRRAFLQTLGGTVGLLMLASPRKAPATPPPPTEPALELSWPLLQEAFGELPDVDQRWQLERHAATVYMYLCIYDTDGALIARLLRCRYNEDGPVWGCRFVAAPYEARVRQVLQHRSRSRSGSAGGDGAIRVGDPVAPRPGVEPGPVEAGVGHRKEVVGGGHPRAAVADSIFLRSAA